MTDATGNANLGAEHELRSVRFFADPAMDRFAAAFLRLLSDHWVQAEKLDHLARLLEESGAIAPGELEARGRQAESDADRDLAADAFVRRILDPLREPASP